MKKISILSVGLLGVLLLSPLGVFAQGIGGAASSALINLRVQRATYKQNLDFKQAQKAFQDAVVNGNKTLVNSLIKQYGSRIINTPFAEKDIYYPEYPLILAVKGQNEEIIKILVNAGANVNVSDADEGFFHASALGHAAFNCQTNIVTFLLDHGATDKNGALIWAGIGNCVGATRVLLARGATNKDDALLAAIGPHGDVGYGGNLQVVNFLLEHKANVNAKSKSFGDTPLMGAAGGGYLKVAKTLLYHGAQVNLTDNMGQTALMWAVNSPWATLEMTTLLVKQGAKVNMTDKNGYTALDYAIENNGEDSEIVRYLRTRGAKTSR